MKKTNPNYTFIFLLIALLNTSISSFGQSFNGGIDDGYSNSPSIPVNMAITPEFFYPVITLANEQLNPAELSPVNFTATFNKNTSNFTNLDVTIGGTANPTTVVVTGGPMIYNIAVSGMTNDGTVSINIAANVCTDAVFYSPNAASVNQQNQVLYDSHFPGVEITYASGQLSPTSVSPVNFKITFTERISGFDNSDIIIGGTAGANTVVISGSGVDYNAAVTGMISDGTITISIPAGICTDTVGKTNTASVNTNNTVNYIFDGPFVTVNQGSTQADTVNSLPILFEVVFSKDVADFSFDDITWSGSASGISGSVTGSGSNFTIDVTGVVSEGTLIPTIDAGKAHDAVGVGNAPSTSTDNSVTFDITRPVVEIILDPLQRNPSNSAVISFIANFSEPVHGFDQTEVTLSGSTGASIIYLRGGPQNYMIDISGMTSPGNVTINIQENVANDRAGNLNLASINTSNSVFFDNVKPDVVISSTITSPTNSNEIPISIEFSKEVTGFEMTDFNISNGIISALSETITGIRWEATVNPLATGIINIQIPANAAFDDAGNFNNASNHFQIEFIGPLITEFIANNIFTPNSTLNRYWKIKNIYLYANYELVIRNASGQVVYKTTNYKNDWNGTYNDKPLPTGTYYYYFSSPTKDKVYKGFINIIYE